MSQLQDLARLLTCSGYTAHPDGEGAYMIYTHDGCAVLKHWTEGCFGKEEIITANIRAGPTASYITESSIVTITQFDEDEEDWVENNNLPRCVVHPEGQLTATLGASGNVVVVFQNEEGRLVYMQEPDEEDTAWTVTEVEDAHKPAFGTPLSIRIEPDSDTSMLRVFYISSSDGAVHCITRVVGDIIWADAFTLSAARGTPLKRIFVEGQRVTACGQPSTVGPRASREGWWFRAEHHRRMFYSHLWPVTVDFYFRVGFEGKKRRRGFF